MKRIAIFLLATVVLAVLSCDQPEKNSYVEIETDFGVMKVMLYNTTPIHRDNFIKLAGEGYYDGTLFHRVMNGFMIQGGDPDSKDASMDQPLGMGGPGYLLDAEIGAPHLKGVLAAAQPPNPEKKSSGSQFYFVQGKVLSDAFLDQIEREKGITYNEVQRKLYKEIGGTPFLDNDYTVFGEVVEGLEIIDKIAAVATDGRDRPLEDIRIRVRVVK